LQPLVCAKSKIFDVCQCTQPNLLRALSNEYKSPGEVGKQHASKYLAGYLPHLNARTIVVEYDYTDADYLDDYSSYYVRCFAPYARRCKRLHFFSWSFAKDDLLRLITRRTHRSELARFKRCYLGFVVARPLPDAIVGRTVLATYGSDGGRRHYSATRLYRANLFGISLQVRSLAFQVQDTVLAACATVALWSAFQKTAELFAGQAPTPAMITRAGARIGHDSRPIPSHGLTLQQICNAVESFGLEPEVFTTCSGTPLPSLIYGYLQFGLPVVIVGVIGEGADAGAGHAITIAGCSIGSARRRVREVPSRVHCIQMTGLRIEAFFAHDDRIGPFAKMELKEVDPAAVPQAVSTVLQPLQIPHFCLYEPTWKQSLYPIAVVVPVYTKIRLTFLELQTWLTRLDAFLKLLRGRNLLKAAGAGMWEWDIQLTTTNRFKHDLPRLGGPAAVSLQRALLDQHPRFVWRATYKINGRNIFELLADATDLERSLPIYAGIWYDTDVARRLYESLADPALLPFGLFTLSRRFCALLCRSLQHRLAGNSDDLHLPCEFHASGACSFRREPEFDDTESLKRVCPHPLSRT